MLAPRYHKQSSGLANVIDNTDALKAMNDAFARGRKQVKEKKEKQETAIIESQEELLDMVGQAHGRDAEYVNQQITAAHEQLANDIEAGVDMSTPEALKKKYDSQLALQQLIAKSKAYQEETVEIGEIINKAKYIDKEGASAAIRAQNALPLNERDSNLGQSIIDGDQFYKFDDEMKDIAFNLEMTNKIEAYNKSNVLNTAHRQGFEQDEKTNEWMVSQELEDRILNGDLSSDRAKKTITKEGQKIADSQDVSLEEGKRMFLNKIMEKHAGNKAKIDQLKVPSIYKPPALALNTEALQKKYDEASAKLLVGDEKALAPFTAIPKTYGWKIETSGGKSRITYRELTKYGSKTKAKTDGATDKYLRAGQWFDASSKEERHNALSPLFKALEGKYLPYGGGVAVDADPASEGDAQYKADMVAYEKAVKLAKLNGVDPSILTKPTKK